MAKACTKAGRGKNGRHSYTSESLIGRGKEDGPKQYGR
jgi:hypothetical protein